MVVKHMLMYSTVANVQKRFHGYGGFLINVSFDVSDLSQ